MSAVHRWCEDFKLKYHPYIMDLSTRHCIDCRQHCIDFFCGFLKLWCEWVHVKILYPGFNYPFNLWKGQRSFDHCMRMPVRTREGAAGVWTLPPPLEAVRRYPRQAWQSSPQARRCARLACLCGFPHASFAWQSPPQHTRRTGRR